MKALLALLCLLPVASFAQESPRLWFIFFVKGDGPRPEQKVLQQMQKDHIGNLEKRFKDGRLIAAGPLNDPTTVRRGIAVLTVPTRKDVDACFTEDPFVQHRIMNIEAHPWTAPRSSIVTELPDPNKIEENRIAILHPLKKAPASTERRQANFLRAASEKGVVASFGTFEDDGQTVLLIQGPEQASVEALLARSPLVREGYARLEVFPLWMAKGVLRPRGGNPDSTKSD